MRMRWWFRRKPPMVLQEVASSWISAEEIESLQWARFQLRAREAWLIWIVGEYGVEDQFEPMMENKALTTASARHYERLERFIERLETMASTVTTT